MNNTDLQSHMLSTYFTLRRGMIILAASSPVVIVVWGWLFGIAWQDSISSYYFAPLVKWEYSSYPTRVLFGGILFSIGTFLYLYKGFSTLENVLLNFAGLFAVGVAMCPMYAERDYIPNSNYLHFSFAVGLFVCMGLTAVFCNSSTLRYIADLNVQNSYRLKYRAIGVLMMLFPFIGLALAYILGGRQVYWIEAAGIEIFAIFWLLKSRELKMSQVDVKAVTNKLPGVVPPTNPGTMSSPDRSADLVGT